MTPLRVGPALELLVFAGSILAFIWILEPLDNPAVTVGFYVCIIAYAIGSSLLHRNPLRQIGIRADTLAASARDVALPTVLAIGLFLAAGWLLGSLRIDDGGRVLSRIGFYYGWGLLQQYALQGVVLLRLHDAGLRRRAPLAAALLFAAMHVPNPGLMALTFAGGWIWCRSFERHPNLFTLAMSHACAAVVANASLPRWFTAGLHIGPGYLHLN